MVMSVKLYARAKELICASAERCAKCPIMDAAYKKITPSDEPRDVLACEVFVIKYPAEAVKLVKQWWKENRHRYPQYERKTDSGIPNDYPDDPKGEALKLWHDSPRYIAEELQKSGLNDSWFTKILESEKRDDPV